jgi:hypothetical protein
MSAATTIPTPPAFDVDFDEVFRLVSADIAAVRVSRKLRPLVPQAAVLVGREYSGQEMSPPRIVVVPTGARYAPGRRVGKQTGVFDIPNANPAIFWLQWLTFRAECWGEETPRGAQVGSSLYSFSTAVELARELMGALVRVLGGVPNIQIDGAEFDQPRDVVRFGRLYVLNFAIGTNVTDEPWVLVNPVTADVAVDITSPDGSSTADNVVQFQVP